MITTSDLTSVKNADKALFFMTKQGCPNCTQVKPMIEKFEAENPDVLVFTHEATSKDDEVLAQFPQIQMFPGVFCMKAGKIVSMTNAIPSPDSFAIGFSTIQDKYMNFGVITRRLTQMETDIKSMKELHAFLNNSIGLEETPTEVPTEPDFLPQVTPAPHEEGCTSCQ